MFDRQKVVLNYIYLMAQEFPQELFVVFRKYNDSFTSFDIDNEARTFSISYTTQEYKESFRQFIKDLDIVSKSFKFKIKVVKWDKTNGVITMRLDQKMKLRDEIREALNMYAKDEYLNRPRISLAQYAVDYALENEYTQDINGPLATKNDVDFYLAGDIGCISIHLMSDNKVMISYPGSRPQEGDEISKVVTDIEMFDNIIEEAEVATWIPALIP
jgi:hypothetical protein